MLIFSSYRYWVGLIIAGVTWPFLLLLPETYAPIILKREAKRLRKETGNSNIFAPAELQKQDLRELVVVVLTRPVRMFLFEVRYRNPGGWRDRADIVRLA